MPKIKQCASVPNNAQFIGWFVDWLACWLVGWPVGWLVVGLGCPVGWVEQARIAQAQAWLGWIGVSKADWLVGSLVGLDGWMVVWLAG